MGLRMLIGAGRADQLAGFEIHVIVALAGAVDAIGPVQAGVEPLRTVRRGHLHGEHVAKLVVEGLCILLGREVAALPAPIGPGAGHAVENLPRVLLWAEAPGLGQLGHGAGVGHGTPQPGRNAILLDALHAGRHARLAEVFLRQNVGGNLAPLLGDQEAVELEDQLPIGILSSLVASRNAISA